MRAFQDEIRFLTRNADGKNQATERSTAKSLGCVLRPLSAAWRFARVREGNARRDEKEMPGRKWRAWRDSNPRPSA